MAQTREFRDFFQQIHEIGENLSPDKSLFLFNVNLSKKYKHTDEEWTPDTKAARDEHTVFELNELLNLKDNPNLEQFEQEFLKQLTSKNELFRPRLAIPRFETFFRDSLKEDKLSPTKPLNPTRAKLRRTIAILYKNSNVPQPFAAHGMSKFAQGPIGINREISSAFIDDVLAKIGPIWKWNGTFPKQVLSSDPERVVAPKESKQFVRIFGQIRENFMGNTVSEYNPTQELRAIAKLFENLTRNSPTETPPSYMPFVWDTKEHTSYVEYIPQYYSHDSLETLYQDTLQLINAYKELWKRGGVIPIDPKKDNFRKRANGDVVIIDWGGALTINPGETVVNPETLETTKQYLPPEADQDEFYIEPFIVFQIGCILVQDLYDLKDIKDTLSKGGGHTWYQEALKDNGVELCSVDSYTYNWLRQQRHIKPKFQLPVEMQLILVSMLDEYPQNRPTLTELERLFSYITKHQHA